MTVLLCASGASCPTLRQPLSSPAPTLFAGPPTQQEVIAAINATSGQIRQLQTDSATLSVQGMPTLRASLAAGPPRNFRLRASFIGVGEVLDLGSNDQVFWAMVDAPQLMSEVPRAVYYARHDQYLHSDGAANAADPAAVAGGSLRPGPIGPRRPARRTLPARPGRTGDPHADAFAGRRSDQDPGAARSLWLDSAAALVRRRGDADGFRVRLAASVRAGPGHLAAARHRSPAAAARPLAANQRADLLGQPDVQRSGAAVGHAGLPRLSADRSGCGNCPHLLRRPPARPIRRPRRRVRIHRPDTG